MYPELIAILNGDIVRNQERYEEARRDDRSEDAALYAGKEAQARRIILLIMAGKVSGN